MGEIRLGRPAGDEADRLEQEELRSRGGGEVRKIIHATKKARKELDNIPLAELTGKRRRSDRIVSEVSGVSLADAMPADEVAEASVYNKTKDVEGLQSGGTSKSRGMKGGAAVRRNRQRTKESLSRMVDV